MIICKQNKFTIYFGVPGSGKSTVAVLLAKKQLKRHRKRVFSNFAIKGTYEFNKDDIGMYDMSNSLIIFDEAGIEFDNRNFKANFNADQLYFFKYHRHYNADIVMFSQDIDVDKKLRKLATELRVVKSSIIPFFVTTKLIKKKIAINDDTGDIIDKYYFVPLSSKRYFSPKAWKLFNSYECKKLSIKEWQKY